MEKRLEYILFFFQTIYDADDLWTYYYDAQNNSMLLFTKTVTQMYLIYKSSLTAIYLKSVDYTYQQMALKIMIWEQLNLVRANFEFMCHRIVTFIQDVETNAVANFNTESKEYKQIMSALQITVNKMLKTAVLSTSVHYKRALNFNTDGSMIQHNYNTYTVDELDTYYRKILWKISNVGFFDMRIVNQQSSPIPSLDMSIPDNMYALTINKLVFQAFICQSNYISEKIQKTSFENTDTNVWIYNQITLEELKYSILFAKCSVIGNKIYSINAATLSYMMLTENMSTQTSQSDNEKANDQQSESKESYSISSNINVVSIMNYVSMDVVDILCIHSVDISNIFQEVEVYINQNSQKITSLRNYKPGMTPYLGSDSNVSSTYFRITFESQITESLKYFQTSIISQFSSSLYIIQSVTETDYTKIIVASLKNSKELFNVIIDYLNSIVSETVKYVAQYATPGTIEYSTAISAIYRDTEERKLILASLIEVPFRRVFDFGLDTTEYLYVTQNFQYTLYVRVFYQYFNIKHEIIYNTNNDADLFLTNSMSAFIEIHETVITVVQQIQESTYKTLLLWHLEQSLVVFDTTCKSIKTHIAESQIYIQQSSRSSQIAFYKEIMARVETVHAIYAATYIKCYKYATNNTFVGIYQSEFEVSGTIIDSLSGTESNLDEVNDSL